MVLVFFVIYILILALIVYISSKDESTQGYIIGSRKVGIIGTLASVVSGMRDGAGIAVWISLAYFFGGGALWLTVGLALALLVLAWIGPIFWRYGTRLKSITLHQVIGAKFGGKTSQLAAIVIAITAILYAAAQINISGRLLSALLGVSPILGMIIAGGIVAAYTSIGGYKTIIATDVLQWGVLLVIAAIPFFIGTSTSPTELFSEFSNMTSSIAIGFVGISFLVVFTSADIWQRILSARTENTTKISMLSAIPIYFALSIGLVLIGLFLKTTLGEVPAKEAFFSVFQSGAISSLLQASLGIFAVAAIMSTLDSQLYVLSSTILRFSHSEGTTYDDKSYVMRTRLIITLAVGTLIFIASLITDIITFLFSAVTLATILAPLIVVTIFGHGRWIKYDKWVAATLVLSAGVYVFLFAGGYFQNVLFTLIPAAIASVFMGVIALSKRQLDKHNSIAM